MWDYLRGRDARCAWCYRPVEWKGVGPVELVVDHVDGDTKNNAIENLAVSCRGCNGNRDRSEPSHVCGWCGSAFKGRRERKFCSRTCSNRNTWLRR